MTCSVAESPRPDSTEIVALAELTELTAREAAGAMRQPYRTVARWLGAWLALQVQGVRRVPSRGRAGLAFRVCPTLIDRWRRGELPVPRMPRAVPPVLL
jgi:hypothetical protein